MPGYSVMPYDLLFFRDNRSFHLGEWLSEGIFPPYPSTFQGFVRAKILMDAGLIDPEAGMVSDSKIEEAEALVGDDVSLRVNINGPYLMRASDSNIWFRTPADLFLDKKRGVFDSSVPRRKAAPAKKSGLATGFGSEIDCASIPSGVKLDDLYPPEYISLSEFVSWRSSLNNIQIKDEPLFLTENRVGIGLDPEGVKNYKSVQEAMFYVTPFIRLRDGMGFYFTVDQSLKQGTLTLGGEKKLVAVAPFGDENLIEKHLAASRGVMTKEIIRTKTFRMVLLQYGVFESGWLPFNMSDTSNGHITTVDGLHLRLSFAFSGPPTIISGYSFMQSRNVTDQSGIKLKPIVRAVPAGAVYCFEITNGTEQQIHAFVNKYDNRKIEYAHYSAMGFNHIALGCGPDFNNNEKNKEEGK